MKSTTMMLLALAALAGCGGKSSGKLPAVCADALEQYAKLDQAQWKQLDLSVQLGLGTVLEQGGGKEKAALSAWQQSMADRYAVTKDLQGQEAADAMLEETETQCKEWQQAMQSAQ